MIDIPCTICETYGNYVVRFPERIPSKIDFSARKMSGRNHFQIVRCKECGVIYSSRIFDENEINKLYFDSDFIEEKQIDQISHDYYNEFKRVLPLVSERDAILELGCANGFFLESVQQYGFKRIQGVEPNKKAVAHADPKIKPFIINDIFTSGLFKPDSFDVVCAFQIFDHLIDPSKTLHEISRILKNGGVLFTINHNIHSILPRVMGEWSPMYDIEHIFLFDPKTMKKLFEKHGLIVMDVRNLMNRYTLEYCFKMFPFPNPIKKTFIKLTQLLKVNNFAIRLSAGNMATIAVKKHP